MTPNSTPFPAHVFVDGLSNSATAKHPTGTTASSHTGDCRDRSERVANHTHIAPAADKRVDSGLAITWTTVPLSSSRLELDAAHTRARVHQPENGE